MLYFRIKRRAALNALQKVFCVQSWVERAQPLLKPIQQYLQSATECYSARTNTEQSNWHGMCTGVHIWTLIQRKGQLYAEKVNIGLNKSANHDRAPQHEMLTLWGAFGSCKTLWAARIFEVVLTQLQEVKHFRGLYKVLNGENVYNVDQGDDLERYIF